MKFFLFRREQISEGSVKSSDSGIGLSVFVIPVTQMAFMTAAKGAIRITFNNAGVYEHTSLFKGESFEKTNVNISCVEGQELALMEDILDFVTSKAPNKLVMRFDVVTGKSTFEKALTDSVSDISTQIKINPIVMSSGEISRGDTEKEFKNTIAGIYFGDNLPSLDFNHEGLSGYSHHDEITAWNNAGTGGGTYNIASNIGDPQTNASSANFSTKVAEVAADDYFIIPNSYTVYNDYTLYIVLSSSTLSTSGLGVIYGDDSGDTMGFCFGDVKYDGSGGINKAASALSTFKIRHDGRTGEPASVYTGNEAEGTTSYKFPENFFNPDGGETCQVFVVRRDNKGNMYLHNREGELVAFIPGFIIANTASGKRTDMSGMTDGDLLIEQLGSGGGIIATSGNSKSFLGAIARFGVIEKDIGTSKAAELARDLFSLYNL